MGPRTTAKNKLKWKENKQTKKANKKADEKLQIMYTSGAKHQYWIAWSVKHEKKRELH